MRILLNKAQVNRIIENYNNSKNIIKEDTGGLFSKVQNKHVVHKKKLLRKTQP